MSWRRRVVCGIRDTGCLSRRSVNGTKWHEALRTAQRIRRRNERKGRNSESQSVGILVQPIKRMEIRQRHSVSQNVGLSDVCDGWQQMSVLRCIESQGQDASKRGVRATRQQMTEAEVKLGGVAVSIDGWCCCRKQSPQHLVGGHADKISSDGVDEGRICNRETGGICHHQRR